MAAKKIICDTDVMIDYFDSSNERHLKTKQILEGNNLNNIVLSAITTMELATGATDKNDLNRIAKKLNRFSIALIDSSITIKAIALIEKYTLSHNMEIPDALIAATAVVNELELFTYNTKDYEFIPELVLFKHH